MRRLYDSSGAKLQTFRGVPSWREGEVISCIVIRVLCLPLVLKAGRGGFTLGSLMWREERLSWGSVPGAQVCEVVLK